MNVKLTKISRPDVAGGLRTNEVDGQTENYPCVGESFRMTGEGLVFGTRFIKTSPVKSVLRDGDKYTFSTLTGSVYCTEF